MQTRLDGWEPTPLHLAALAEELAKRIPHPVDQLEVAAVLESMGITDEVAFQEFAQADVFALAAKVFPILRTIQRRRESGDSIDDPGERRRASRAANERAVAILMLALSPLALLMLVARTLSGGGQGSVTTVAALWGISAGMLLVAGPTFAIGRRSAILAGLGYVDQQRLYLRTRALRGLALLGVALVSFLVLAQAARVSSAVAAAFGLGAAGLGLGWMLVNFLLFAGQTRVVGVCLVLGSGAGAGVAAAASPLPGLYTGAGTALLLLTTATFLLGHGVATSARRPRGRLLALESVPYASYAVLAIALMIAPATLAWLDDSGGHSRVEVAGEVGVAFTAAIVPTAISLMFVERSLRGYWDFLRTAAERHAIGGFRDAVRTFEATRILRYAVFHGALSAAAASAFLLLSLATDLEQTIDTRNYLAGLAFYLLVGCIQFTGMLLVNFSKPWRASAPLAVGFAFASGASAGAVLVGHPDGIPIVVVAAAAIGLGVALWSWSAAAKDIPYSYSTAF